MKRVLAAQALTSTSDAARSRHARFFLMGAGAILSRPGKRSSFPHATCDLSFKALSSEPEL